MALVEYPDSDEEDENAEPQIELQVPAVKKRKAAIIADAKSELPALPPAFRDLYATNVRAGTKDDPSLHGGRKRHVPHVEGNWPTHVYLEWNPSPPEFQLLESLISTTTTTGSNKVHSLLQDSLSVPLPLHISLSRSLVLPTEKRDEFLTRVRANVNAAAVKSFAVKYYKVAWYPNHDKSRWFLSLGAKRPERDELNRLLGACNRACAEMGQPELYASSSKEGVDVDGDGEENLKKRKFEHDKDTTDRGNPSNPDCSSAFHVSLAWSLEAQALNRRDDEARTGGQLAELTTKFDAVKVKIGNIVHSLPLK